MSEKNNVNFERRRSYEQGIDDAAAMSDCENIQNNPPNGGFGRGMSLYVPCNLRYTEPCNKRMHPCDFFIWRKT